MTTGPRQMLEIKQELLSNVFFSFSIKILKGTRGSLVGGMFTYSLEFENCPKLERLIKQSGSGVPEITTPPIEIRATTNLYGVELKYQFPYCKKAKTDQ